MTTETLRAMNKEQLVDLIEHNLEHIDSKIAEEAYKIRLENFGETVYFRGLIEITSYCHCKCYYCGISALNEKAKRYRLDKPTILNCCATGYDLGFRSFVLQGGEDNYFTDEILCDIIFEINHRYPDCAMTLSLGERSYESYSNLFAAGANRYLLRHETATDEHYNKLHGVGMKLSERKKCLTALKEIGFQTGAGFMVGSPFQTNQHLAEDLLFLKELNPHMVGIGPFVPHKDTKFGVYPSGKLNKTLLMIALTRILLPKAMLPSTTALGSIDDNAREKAFKLGANVVMPNLSPSVVRSSYSLYDNKVSGGAEAAEGKQLMINRIESAGFIPTFTRGDFGEYLKNY